MKKTRRFRIFFTELGFFEGLREYGVEEVLGGFENNIEKS